MGKIWTIASGSGGTGKSSIAVALAQIAAGDRKKTLLLDAAGPFRTCDLFLGIQSLVTVDLTDVLVDHVKMDSAIYSLPGSPFLSYACTSLVTCLPLDELSELILALQGKFDLIILDLPTGSDPFSASLMKGEDRILLVTRPDPFSLRPCEALMQNYRSMPAQIVPVVNLEDRALLRRKMQYDSDTMSLLLDSRVLGPVPRIPDFFTLKANGEEAASLSWKEQRIFRRIYEGLA
ncbi:MAG: AAA family ATPase [Clostridia bacterium]|nr:AAA family ATPase [Clostridia bacterium]